MFQKLSTTAVCVVLAAAAMAVDAVAAGHHAKVARGHTGQGRAIRMSVSPEKIDLKGFSIELQCSGGYTLVDQESGFEPTPIGRGGRIHDRQYGTTDEVLLRGRVTAGAVHGRVRVRDRLGKHRCSSPWVPFTARVRGGRDS